MTARLCWLSPCAGTGSYSLTSGSQTMTVTDKLVPDLTRRTASRPRERHKRAPSTAARVLYTAAAWLAIGARSEHPSRHAQTAEAAEERRHDRHADRRERPPAG